MQALQAVNAVGVHPIEPGDLPCKQVLNVVVQKYAGQGSLQVSMKSHIMVSQLFIVDCSCMYL